MKPKTFLESILEENLVLSFEREAFDRYERLLVYLSAEDQDAYNLKLVQAGYALPYFIYPNAVSPTEEGEFTYDTIEKFQDAAVKAKRTNLGIWEFMDRILLPMELRFLTRRELPVKYCADLSRNLLYSPQYYFKVPIENRLFFYPKDVLVALQKKFRPTPDCDGWLHKIWRALHKSENHSKEVENDIMKKEE
ncbi:MAG: thermonuclease family protein [Theionarchaea archaeon]|nr:thermonuclease family protein [Theionarchaea archaeon]